ncbi:MAG TPA: C1 family peptidase [Polyangiaceae bacterium]|nr:C1 family peptidase [Polyangiaceae bacterium]
MRSRCLLVAAAAVATACHGQSDSGGSAGPAVVASADLTPAKRPPPLRAPRPAAPSLPDLPALASHDAPVTAPAGTDFGDSPCHAVWTGSEAAPLACARSLLFGADQGGGAVPLVARKLLSHDPSGLPAVVDHRVDGTEGPVRNQSSAPACTAFATAAAIDHALARWGGGNPAVSVMEIWSRYHSPEVETSLSSNVGQALGSEQQWPFRAAEATTWVPCSDFARPPRSGCGNPVDAAHARAVLANPVGELTEVEYLGTSADTGMLQAKLAAGQDVIVTMELPSAFVPRGRAGAVYVPNYTKSAGPDAGHAMVIAGYAHLPHGTYFLLHNSWGPGWGDGGYAWVHEATLHRWVRSVVAVDAEPLERGPGSRPRPKRAATTCAGDLVPDSIRASCAPACPDHSPRHDGVCPVAGQCAAGFVNLTGNCVLAAPTASGKDSGSGATWSCGPGGCAYEIPRTSDPACTGARCRASCPAPDFILARMGDALVCVE